MPQIFNPDNEENFRIAETSYHTFLVRSDSQRFGRNAITYESHDRTDCVKYITQRRPPRDWRVYIVPDLKTWATNRNNQTPIEYYDTFAEAKARYDLLRWKDYNQQIDFNSYGNPYAHLVMGMESLDGCAADLLQVRGGKNCMNDDFTRMDEMNTDPAVLEVLETIANGIGFDTANIYQNREDGMPAFIPKVIPFEQWSRSQHYFKVQPADRENWVDTFDIYQLRSDDETARNQLFMSGDYLARHDLTVSPDLYELVYSGTMAPDTTLDDLYELFNLDHPEGFRGHSLSVSDVVVTHVDGKDTAHFVDSIGFLDVSEQFIKEELEPPAAGLKDRITAAAQKVQERILPASPSKTQTKEMEH